MNSIPDPEIERRGMSAVDDSLRIDPVPVMENDRPRYVVLAAEDDAHMTAGPSAWDCLDQPSRATRDKAAIDADVAAERDAWKRST
ncbi:type II toxin-antitoxin system Phd/YefM family antitoxin [uncultured Thiodictyon sp.]|uniref:type II toxin-antitoxin system Phd/YefM family antitoxin n=1 Tax=uncultured Thiodictyon sp. TaxID=1846217 RepID=UPI0025CEA7CE|nr:type II toxin-antitoxin system Phd/YefM family antitoxin [uncultured Thiodictyon sp.]